MYSTNIPFISDKIPSLGSYFIVYKSLLALAPSIGLDINAVFLYSLLRDRAIISAENEWIDESGRVFIIYTRAQVAEETGWSKRKVIDTFRALSDANLIEEEVQRNRSGCNVAPRIYVRQWVEPITKENACENLSYITPKTGGFVGDSYYTIPRMARGTLFGQLPVRAKLLYAMILDTIQLSIRCGRADSDGFWCSLKAEDTQSLLQCGHNTLSSTYKMLVDLNLCYRVKKECGCSTQLYLRPCWCDTVDQKVNLVMPKVAHQSSDYVPVNDPIIAPQRTEKSTQINSSKKACISFPHSVSLGAHAPDAAEVKSVFLEQMDADQILIDFLSVFSGEEVLIAREILSRCVSVIVKDSMCCGNRIRMGQEFVFKEDLLDAYRKIDRYIMIVLIRKAVSRWDEIRAPQSYLRSAMYTAWSDHEGETYVLMQQLISSEKAEVEKRREAV